MVVMEFNQLTGFKTPNVDDLKNQANNGIKRVENNDEKVVIYFDGVIVTIHNRKRRPSIHKS